MVGSSQSSVLTQPKKGLYSSCKNRPGVCTPAFVKLFLTDFRGPFSMVVVFGNLLFKKFLLVFPQETVRVVETSLVVLDSND